MTGNHYDVELLLDLQAAGGETIGRDEHLRACTDCRETLESLSGVASALRSPDVWDGPELSKTPNASVLATLRGAQSRMRSEDAVAEESVKHLLSGPRESWAPRLAAHPEWRTAGTVRKLIAATDRAIETMPPDALEIANLAVAIAEGLPSDSTFSVARLRAHAWREKAYALFFLGHYSDAEGALERTFAELATVDAAGAEFDAARALVLRALITRVHERYAETISDSREAANVFMRFGQNDKYVAARRVEALTYYATRQFKKEIELLTSLSKEQVTEQDRAAIAQNIAMAYAELGDIDVAQQYYAEAIREFDRLNMITGRAKTKWNLARRLMAAGRYRHALEELVAARNEFEELGMTNDVAMTSLDIAESYIALNRNPEAVTVCRDLMKYFEAAGLSTTSGALTALSFLAESIDSGRATSSTVLHVKTFLENAPSHPTALFVPPPDFG